MAATLLGQRSSLSGKCDSGDSVAARVSPGNWFLLMSRLKSSTMTSHWMGESHVFPLKSDKESERNDKTHAFLGIPDFRRPALAATRNQPIRKGLKA